VGLDVFFREDIQRAIDATLAVAETTMAETPDSPTRDAWLRGFGTAITVFARFFGITISRRGPCLIAMPIRELQSYRER